MVLNQLKQIRNELKSSADAYDAAFKTTALIAATELVERENKLGNNKRTPLNLSPSLDKQYFTDKYGSLKNAKAAYQKIYGERKYGRSWSDFIIVAKKLDSSSPQQKALTLEERITRIENFLIGLGFQP